MSSAKEFLGVQFDTLDMRAVEDWISDRDESSSFAYIVTPNVDHVVRLNTDAVDLEPLYAAAGLRLCDSVILQRVAHVCGVSLTVVRGSDLVEVIFARILKSGDRVLVVGGSGKDIATLRSLHPSLLLFHCDPPMGLRQDEAARRTIVEAAAKASARLILLAVGSPQQEMLAYEMAQQAGLCGTALCIGASIEFLTGTQKRAPVAWRRSGMEWAWRLFANPRRFARRYLLDDPAIFGIAWRWRSARSWRNQDTETPVSRTRRIADQARSEVSASPSD